MKYLFFILLFFGSAFSQEKSPLDISDLKQCDPYSSFGVFCNAGSFWEGIIIIIGIVIMFAGSMWFVKKNQEAVQREKGKDV